MASRTMALVAWLLVLLCVTASSAFSVFSSHLTAAEDTGLKPIVKNCTIGDQCPVQVNSSVEYIIVLSNTTAVSDTQPARITVECKNASREFPVLVVLRQARGVLSWQLPLMVPTEGNVAEYHNTSRTLCPNRNYKGPSPFTLIPRPSSGGLVGKSEVELDGGNHDVFISISSASKVTLKVNIFVDTVKDFIVELGNNQEPVVRHLSASPSEPHYYQFNWPQNKPEVDSVLLDVDSKDDGDICMTVSIQNITCPVFDLERSVQFEGFWQTVNRRGGMTLTKDSFPSGFYVVFVVKSDDYDCTGKITKVTERSKRITFTIQQSIGTRDYKIAVAGTVLAFFSFYLISFIVGVVYYVRRRNSENFITNEVESSSEIERSYASTSKPNSLGNVQTPVSDISGFPGSDDSSLDETDIDTLADAELDKDVVRSKRVLYVCDLARKNPQILRKKSLLYFWNLLTVATFYALPVVQLVFSYQMVMRQTGNQDLCYYNFLCAHPLWFVSDFNHIFSNVGYVALGFLFVLLTYRRDKMHCRAVAEQSSLDKHYGIPQHYGLFYAMGAALMMEGFLSGCYHVCPNHSNFQFDTSFMYVISMLCMLKIYHTRHPDINASAYATFGMLALVIFVGMCGILSGTTSFWVGFTVLHISVCLWLTGKIYYLGRLCFGFNMFTRAFRIFRYEFLPHPCTFLWPKYPSRMVLLILGNMCNWALAAVVWVFHLDNFGSYLLAIFMANLLLYTFFYIIMKLCNRERILLQPLVYIVLATGCWMAALYFFFMKSTSWTLTAAESRRFNKECEVILSTRFYDRHDIWHFLSAASMFFSFMVLLTWDDDLVHVPRTQIPVF